MNAPTVAALKEKRKLAFTISQSVYEQAYWSVATCVTALNGGPSAWQLADAELKVVDCRREAAKYDESPEVLRRR